MMVINRRPLYKEKLASKHFFISLNFLHRPLVSFVTRLLLIAQWHCRHNMFPVVTNSRHSGSSQPKNVILTIQLEYSVLNVISNYAVGTLMIFLSTATSFIFVLETGSLFSGKLFIKVRIVPFILEDVSMIVLFILLSKHTGDWLSWCNRDCGFACA